MARASLSLKVSFELRFLVIMRNDDGYRLSRLRPVTMRRQMMLIFDADIFTTVDFTIDIFTTEISRPLIFNADIFTT